MPSAPHIIQLRQKRRQAAQKNPAGRIGLGVAFLFTLLAAVFLIVIPHGYATILRDLPSLEAIPLLLEPADGLLLHPTLILDRSGKHILQRVQNPAVVERRYLPISSETDPDAGEFIAPEMVDATVSIVDPTFWSNPGFSTEGLFNDQATTLAQQLAGDLLIPAEASSLRRAVRERILGWQIVSQFGRPKVLEWYLNSTYYGNLAYGVDAAAQVYFGKAASELNLAEAALLTAVGQAPALNPLDAPDEALKRQKIVLDAMVAQGYIRPEEAIEAAGEQIEFRAAVEEQPNPAQAYLNLVWEQLAPFYDLEQIERGGYQIVTSLDYDLQLQVVCARETLLARLQNPAANFSTPDCPAARLLPTLAIEAQSLPPDLNATVVVLQPGSGQILALVGEPSLGLDPAHLPGASPGSMLTPFLYLTAFTRGFSPTSLVWDVPVDIPEMILPEPEEYQGPVRLRVALANDYLIPALQTMSQIGADNVWRTAQELGLSAFARSADESGPASCRGCGLLFDGGQITLLDLTQAYSTFANQGLLVGQPLGAGDTASLPPLAPISVLSIHDIHGQEWLGEPDTERRPVITQQLAYLITHALSDEAARWPSMGHPNSLEIGRPAAVKTGKTSDQQDTWTVGYTPQIVVGVWAGNGNSAVSEETVPVKISAALWNVITQYATQDLPPADWEVPPGISFVDVCDPSGELPTRHCPRVVSEIFLNGNEPTQFDMLYQASQINRETELLATVFTPPELIEERVYMKIPPIASQWAQENQIATPPESYDVIAMPPINPEARITAPEMFANVSGEIDIRGTANGGDFVSYRLQAGQGVNPQAWIQISADNTTPVENGSLASWDTGKLNGLFAIQMIVLRENRQVDTATIQVTVDNLPPEVFIPYPENGQSFEYQSGRYITLQAEASDNIGLESVVFYMGDQELIRQSQPPYAVPWRISPGKHTLRVEVTDFAGNTSEASITFSVEE